MGTTCFEGRTVASFSMDPERKRRQAEAYKLQVAGASEGALRWTLYGLIFSTTLHFTWPWFRKQTLAGKGFIVSSFTIFGLVTWADHYLLSYEKNERQENEMLRHAAQRHISNSGRIASEGEIRAWIRENREAQVRSFQTARAQPSQTSEWQS